MRARLKEGKSTKNSVMIAYKDEETDIRKREADAKSIFPANIATSELNEVDEYTVAGLTIDKLLKGLRMVLKIIPS